MRLVRDGSGRAHRHPDEDVHAQVRDGLELRRAARQHHAAPLVGLLPQGEADLDTAAKKLCMSPRSLQRHLADDGYSFRELLDETRKALAMEYVRNGRHPLIEVAFRLGFSDQSAFSKAFRRWTGLSPAAFATTARGR